MNASVSVNSDSRAKALPPEKTASKMGNEEPKEEETPPSPVEEEDEEIRLAMEMALAAAQNPHLSPAEIQKLVGEKNKQAKMIEEIAQKKALQQKQEVKKANSWWSAAAKKAEEMKDLAERRLYADLIKKDPDVLEIRRKITFVRKTLKAHRLQGNRVETRHAFKRQRMEKKLIQTNEKLAKTQHLFTRSTYNVQEYLKAMMKASKKWRKKGSDEELMLEAQLCRNMHQMLALEKQKVKSTKNAKEMKKYLQRCKSWLNDKKSFCEMNLTTLSATHNAMEKMYQDLIQRQDEFITKLKKSDEFKAVDLSDVDVSHVDIPRFETSTASLDYPPLRGLPITDSIRVTRERSLSGEKNSPPPSSSTDQNPKEPPKTEHGARTKTITKEGQTRQELVRNYFKQQEEAEMHGKPEIFVETQDNISVSSHLSDPDASVQGPQEEEDDDSESNFHFGNDAPWMASGVGRDIDSTDDNDETPDEKPRGASIKEPQQQDPCKTEAT
jgi:hypothetical protein